MLNQQMVRALRQSILEDATREMHEAARLSAPISPEVRESLAGKAASIAALSTVLEDDPDLDWDFLAIVAEGS